ncbi:MAG: DUF362 domain-containing protein [Opitutales bacterium]
MKALAFCGLWASLAWAQEGLIYQDPYAEFLWETQVAAEVPDSYKSSVEALLQAYEAQAGERINPGDTGRVALKLYTASGAGLSTPQALVSALGDALQARGFERKNIYLVDYDSRGLKAAGYVAPLSVGSYTFDGMPVIALDEGAYFNDIWFYDNALPPRRPRSFSSSPILEEERSNIVTEEERRSYLPTPLFLDTDFWINLPMFTDHAVMTMNGALVNATLRSVSNAERFLKSRATGPVAVAEIAAIPELREKWKFSIASLSAYQYIGGPRFNAHYTRSEPVLWLSTNPTAMDAMALELVNQARKEMGFDAVNLKHPLFEYAEALGLGFADESRLQVISVEP